MSQIDLFKTRQGGLNSLIIMQTKSARLSKFTAIVSQLQIESRILFFVSILACPLI